MNAAIGPGNARPVVHARGLARAPRSSSPDRPAPCRQRVGNGRVLARRGPGRHRRDRWRRPRSGSSRRNRRRGACRPLARPRRTARSTGRPEPRASPPAAAPPAPPRARAARRACLEQALRLAQLGLDAPALGRVPSDAVHDAALGHRPRVPLEPPHGAVGADDAGLEPSQIVTLRELRQRLARRLYVIRMEDVESGSREELRLRVPQEAHERRVHALELAVEADDATSGRSRGRRTPPARSRAAAHVAAWPRRRAPFVPAIIPFRCSADRSLVLAAWPAARTVAL